jgi:drug/metabolite transporter (DMT)-like permease
MSVAALGVFVHYLINHGGAQLLHYQPAVYGYSVLMAVVATVVPSYLIVEGIRLVGAGNAAIIGSVGPISTILLAYLFLGETVSLVQIIGTVIVLSGILLITIKKEKPVKVSGSGS